MSEPVATDSPAATSEAAAEPKAPEAPKVPEAAEAEPSDEYEIDGRKVTLTRTQARTMLQKAGAVDKRFQEAAEQKKKLDSLVADFEKDPEAALSKMGKDPEKILQALLERKAKLALLTPEQRESQSLKDQLDALKADRDKRDEETKAKAEAELDEHNSLALEQQFVDIANKYGLDAAPETLVGLCDVALDFNNHGIHPTGDQVAQEYIRREEEHIEARDRKLLPKLKGERLRSYLKSNVAALLSMPPSELLEMLGPAGVKAIQEATLTKLPGTPATKPKPPVAPPPRNGTAGRWISEHAFDKKFK